MKNLNIFSIIIKQYTLYNSCQTLNIQTTKKSLEKGANPNFDYFGKTLPNVVLTTLHKCYINYQLDYADTNEKFKHTNETETEMAYNDINTKWNNNVNNAIEILDLLHEYGLDSKKEENIQAAIEIKSHKKMKSLV